MFLVSFFCSELIFSACRCVGVSVCRCVGVSVRRCVGCRVSESTVLIAAALETSPEKLLYNLCGRRPNSTKFRHPTSDIRHPDIPTSRHPDIPTSQLPKNLSNLISPLNTLIKPLKITFDQLGPKAGELFYMFVEDVEDVVSILAKDGHPHIRA